jgi:VanZ family protein
MPRAARSGTLAAVSPRSITLASRLALAVTVSVILWLATTDRPPPGLAQVSDKLNHAAAFLVLAALADRAFPASGFAAAKIVPLLAFGVAIEVIQSFLPFREASLMDVAADAAGLVLYGVARPLVLRFPMLWPPANG